MRSESAVEPPESAWDTVLAIAATIALLTAVFVAPWCAGGVFAWSQVVFLGAAAAGLACWVASPTLGRTPLLAALLLAGVLWGCLQIAPLGDRAVAALSPKVAEWRQAAPPVASASFIDDQVDQPSRAVLSVDAAATRQDVVLLALAFAVVLLAARFVGQGAAAPVFLSATMITGAAVGFVGLVQRASESKKLLWLISIEVPRVAFGPFVNENQAGGYLNLCLAAAIGVVVQQLLARGRRSGELSAPRRPQVFTGWVALAATCGLFTVAGVVGCASRGAWLSLAAGAIAVSAAAALHRRSFAAAAAPLAACAAGIILLGAVGIWQRVGEEVESLQGEVVAQNDRLAMWGDAAAAANDFLLTGSGYGTFKNVIEPYRQDAAVKTYDHAENQFVESAVVGGAVGLLLLLAALGLAFASAVVLLRAADDGYSTALAYGFIFALVTQSVHSLFDFGLYLPANMMLLAAWSGAAGGACIRDLRRNGKRDATTRSPAWLGLPATVSAAAGTAGLLACVLGLVERSGAAAVESAMRGFDPEVVTWETPPETIQTAIGRLEDAVRRRWDDSAAHLRLAELHSLSYRRAAFEALLQVEENRTADPETAWRAVSTLALHARYHEAIREGNVALVETIQTDPLIVGRLGEAVNHLVAARRANPLAAKASFGLAELSFLLTDPTVEPRLLENAVRCSPSNPALLLYVGALDWQAGRREAALAAWARCWKLDETYGVRIAAFAMNAEELQQMLDGDVVPRSPIVYARLVREAFSEPSRLAERTLLLERIAAIKSEVDERDAEALFAVGWGAAQRGDAAEAAKWMHRAVEASPTESEWRFELAETLTELGEWKQAESHLEFCISLRPGNLKYKNRLEQLRRRLAAGEF